MGKFAPNRWKLKDLKSPSQFNGCSTEPSLRRYLIDGEEVNFFDCDLDDLWGGGGEGHLVDDNPVVVGIIQGEVLRFDDSPAPLFHAIA
jgi:hypothetical protein